MKMDHNFLCKALEFYKRCDKKNLQYSPSMDFEKGSRKIFKKIKSYCRNQVCKNDQAMLFEGDFEGLLQQQEIDGTTISYSVLLLFRKRYIFLF